MADTSPSVAQTPDPLGPGTEAWNLGDRIVVQLAELRRLYLRHASNVEPCIEQLVRLSNEPDYVAAIKGRT